MVDRSVASVGFPLRALVRVDATVYEPEACPQCARGVPLASPGSRAL